jgi:rifampicin phosphotransferase
VAVRPDDTLIAWLGRSDAAAESLGGKGASLDRLGRMGFHVPPGFCLTTAAFRLQLAATVDSSLGASGAVDVAAVADGLAFAELAPELGAALDAAVARLVREVGAAGYAPRFAVRSSAVGEDGTTASYAGLHETELDVPPDGIAGAVRRCWASLWSPAAVAYRRRRDLSAADAAMAVVVQALVPADAAAVVFTQHPVTGREDQLVLTAVRGLGDAMVAGTVTPDTFVVDKASGSTLTFEPGDGERGPGGGAALDPAGLAELVALSLDVEARFGRPVDIEAATANGRWYLLQARPITTGGVAPAPAPAA